MKAFPFMIERGCTQIL